MNEKIHDCTRWLSDDDIEIWKRGEKELKRWIGVSMTSIFERDGDKVEVYYDKEEGEKVHEAICKFLEDDKNFSKLADEFVQIVIEKKRLSGYMMPFLIIADEIDNYPEIASADDKRRLMRLRTSTHEESYKK